MLKVIFVCTGNTCRSPMAKYILEDKINKLDLIVKSKIRNNIKVESRGLNVVSDDEISFNSKKIIETALGIDVNHVAKQLDLSDLNAGKCLVLTMGKSHKNYILDNFKINDVFTIYDYAYGDEKNIDTRDVIDPFGGNLDIYKNTYEILNELMNMVLNRIIRDYFI